MGGFRLNIKPIHIILPIAVALATLTGVFIAQHLPRGEDSFKDAIYSNNFYWGYGSAQVIITEEGKVYMDEEVEQPGHKTNYKFNRDLTKEELTQLNELLDSPDECNEYVERILELGLGFKDLLTID